MTSTSRGLIIALGLASLGLWGCAQNKAGADSAAKLRTLETRHAKLEADYQAVATANEGIRKRLAQVEAARADLAKKVEELAAVVRERDALKKTLAERTGERDALHNQLVQFGQELHGLLGRVEAAANSSANPATTSLTTFKTN
jgi:septal ring factor EnvC (AmiA/AmiB activator)